jgi:hypothetical protein
MAISFSNIPDRDAELSDEAQFFQNPWGGTTEKFRSQLLLISIIGVFMAAAGIYPREINTLGLKVSDMNPRALLVTWALIDAYLVVSYPFYAYSDFMRGYWRVIFSPPKVEKVFFDFEVPGDEDIDNFKKDVRDLKREMEKLKKEVEKQKGRMKNIHIIRLIIDVVIPILSGIVSLVWLIWRSFTI